MNRRVAIRLLAAGAAVAAVVTLAAVRAASHPPVMAVAVDVLVGLSFVVVGVVAWLRRPDNDTGRLMTAVGFAWFIRDVFWLGGCWRRRSPSSSSSSTPSSSPTCS